MDCTVADNELFKVNMLSKNEFFISFYNDALAQTVEGGLNNVVLFFIFGTNIQYQYNPVVKNCLAKNFNQVSGALQKSFSL